MSSKTVHSITGLMSGGLLIYLSSPPPLAAIAIIAGSVIGASAPDWLEIARWQKKFRWFSANESHRQSVIPHRTITHTLLLWVLLAIYDAYLFATTPTTFLSYFLIGFLVSGFVHLLCDLRTPMGIPLTPFGRRYRFVGFKLIKATGFEHRRGWL